MSEFISKLNGIDSVCFEKNQCLTLIHPDEISSQNTDQAIAGDDFNLLTPNMELDRDPADDELQLSSPYRASPEDIYSTSINSDVYDKVVVDDLVYIGMCDLYEKVIPVPTLTDEELYSIKELKMMPPEFPYRTDISSQSYSYTSDYEHNKLVVTIFEFRPSHFGNKMYVCFTIEPIHSPSPESESEASKIEKFVLDVIYEKLYDHFEYIKQEDYQQTQQYNEHSY